MTDKKTDPKADPAKPGTATPQSGQAPYNQGTFAQGGAQGATKKPSAIIDLKATVVDAGKDAVATAVGAAKTVADAAAKASEAKGDAKADAKASPTTSVPGTASTSDAKKAADSPKAAAVAKPTSSTPSAQTSTPITPVAASRGGFFSHMAAGLLGAVATLFGVSTFGSDLGLGSGASPELTRRLAALEQATGKIDVAGKMTASESRIAKLEEAANALAQGQVRIATEAKAIEDKVAKETTGPFVERVTKLEDMLKEISAAAANDPKNAGRIPQLAQMTTKLGDLETALAQRTAALKTEMTQQLEQRLARQGEQTETARSLLAQRTQSVEQSLKSVTEETTSLRANLDGVKSDLDQRFRTAAKATDLQAAVAPIVTKMATLETNMQGVVKSEQDRNATAGNILLSLELANLKRALDRGGKFTSELDAVKKLSGGKLNLAALETQAAAGVPSLAVLGQELRGLAHTMLDADAEPTDASISDRMLSGMKSIVRVRKTTHAPGDNSAEATIARMETALKEGRLADVMDEAVKLPTKTVAPAAKWLERIKSRHAVDKALVDLDASLKSSLAGGANPTSGPTSGPKSGTN